ncbi:hypothetical protein HN51_032824 [Arachis hypogaea]
MIIVSSSQNFQIFQTFTTVSSTTSLLSTTVLSSSLTLIVTLFTFTAHTFSLIHDAWFILSNLAKKVTYNAYLWLLTSIPPPVLVVTRQQQHHHHLYVQNQTAAELAQQT